MGQYDKVHLTVVQNAALLVKLNLCTADFIGDASFRATYGAPTVILVSAAAGDPDDVRYCNAACIVENMHLAATDLGLGSVYLLGCIRALAEKRGAAAGTGRARRGSRPCRPWPWALHPRRCAAGRSPPAASA